MSPVRGSPFGVTRRHLLVPPIIMILQTYVFINRKGRNMANRFKFGLGQNAHEVGNDKCNGCRWDRPRPCEECWAGLVHVELSPKKTGPVFLGKCDVCNGKGPTWREGRRRD